MKYKLFISRLPAGESWWEWQLGPELLEEVGATYDILDLGVEVRVRARKEVRYLRLAIELSGWVVVPCDRGLEPIRLTISAQHDQIYSWDEHYLPPEEAEEFFPLGPREDEIDLTQAFYDYVGLAIPMKRVLPGCPTDACPAHIRDFLTSQE
uniref:Hypothetical conserved protein n=1 Tax=uncultured Bacteroidota bacterium TaxID=152509 RepID=H5SNU9_9BACT|nr:hypothetical conserved protein [uncultured Bacteroidetes bacterium]